MSTVKQGAIQGTKEEKQKREIEINTKWAVETRSDYDPTSIALQISKMFSLLESKDPGVKKRTREVLKYNISQLQVSEELKTFHSLVKSVHYEYKPMVFKFMHGLMEEYGLTAPSEIALAEIATNAHIRVLSVSSRLSDYVWDESPTPTKGMYLNLLSKELDRANRTYFSAMTLLKQLKAPAMRVNIKTNTAFVAQNQQFNKNEAKSI